MLYIYIYIYSDFFFFTNFKWEAQFTLHAKKFYVILYGTFSS